MRNNNNWQFRLFNAAFLALTLLCLVCALCPVLALALFRQ